MIKSIDWGETLSCLAWAAFTTLFILGFIDLLESGRHLDGERYPYFPWALVMTGIIVVIGFVLMVTFTRITIIRFRNAEKWRKRRKGDITVNRWDLGYTLLADAYHVIVNGQQDTHRSDNYFIDKFNMS